MPGVSLLRHPSQSDHRRAVRQHRHLLFDQILRRRIAPGDRILDAGCGFGRNLVYPLREGYEVHGADADPLKTTVVQGQRSMTTWVVRKD